MNDLAHCPYCSLPASGESVTLWDARAYCRKCVEEVSPELYDFAASGSRLEETVDHKDVSVFHFLSYVGKWTLVGISLIFGLPLGLAVLDGRVDIWTFVAVLALLNGIGIVVLLLFSAVGILSVRLTLPQRISLDDREVKVVTPRWETSFDLSDCTWHVGDTGEDLLSLFTGLRRGIVIQTPEAKVVCGQSPEALERWRAFLTLSRIPEVQPLGCLSFIAIACLGLIVGGPVGVVIGHLVAGITQDDIWPFALGLLGAIDGAAVALIYAGCTSVNPEVARKRLHPAVLGAVFFILGVKVGLLAGLPDALICGGINAVFGALVGWFTVRTRLQPPPAPDAESW